MKHSFLYLIALIGLTLCPALSKAQYIVDYKRDADNMFNEGKYYAAAVYYQKSLNLLPDDISYVPYNVYGARGKEEKKDIEKYQYLVYRLGESFRLYKDYKSAEKWYKKVISFKNDEYPLAKLWYGVTLRADKKYDSAYKVLKTFQSEYEKVNQYSRRARREIKSCEFALKQLRYPRLAEIKKLTYPVHAEKGSDYAPMRIADTLYFTSSRAATRVNSKKHNPFINKVYVSTAIAKGQFVGLKMLELTKDKLAEAAATSLNSEKNRLYFTEWHTDKKGGNTGQYVIMMSKLESRGNWGTPIKLEAPVNVEGYNSKEATITADGKYLIFASDRKDGFGGYDLWVCTLDKEGMPIGKAVNLGSTINTDVDELNPYYDVDKKELIFSTNGRIGMGGFDLYKSKGSFEDNQWTKPENFGYPVNSSKDDNYYYPYGKKGHFYTSSDRSSVCCLDLYAIQLKKLKVKGNVLNKDTKTPVSNLKVVLKDSITGRSLKETTTSKDGYYQFLLDNKRPLKMVLSNKRYGKKDTIITNRQLKSVDSVYTFDIFLNRQEKNQSFTLKNIYFDFDKATLRKESKPALVAMDSLFSNHKKWVIVIGSYTDDLGEEDYNKWLSLKRSQTVVSYLAAHGLPRKRFIPQGYGSANPIRPNRKPDGSDNPKGRQLNRRTEFMVVDTIRINGKKVIDTLFRSVVGNPSKIRVDYSLERHLSEQYYSRKKIDLSNYELVPSINLSLIHYAYNQFNLRYTSKMVLDSVVKILTKYPDMVVQLVSHKNIEGPESYNVGLSRRRTNSCAVYLQNRGIAKYMMVLGEEKQKGSESEAERKQKSPAFQKNALKRYTEIRFWRKK